MQRTFYSSLLLLSALSWNTVTAQTSPVTVDFESFGLNVGQFRNDATPQPYFESSSLRLPNKYTTPGNFWTGWAISAVQDTVSAGFMNQYASWAGSGAESTLTYALAYSDGKMILQGNTLLSFKISNNTYAALSMRDGDPFAKRFGGITGTDPDFLSVTFRGWSDGVQRPDSVVVYLADFRSADPAEDFILKQWQEVNTEVFGNIDSLTYSFRSSDVGSFGINTPTYFCADQLRIGRVISVQEARATVAVSVFPNPSQGHIQFRDLPVDLAGTPLNFEIFDLRGRSLQVGICESEISLEGLSPGLYQILLSTMNGDRGVARVVVE